ncbi:MAG: M48 family metallopeptidase [Leptotrichiaceae bacterium]|nr:M48 family metallopeptidase [Leptotrichiaceae bacterium]
MKKILKTVIILTGAFLFTSCATAPLTGRTQLKLVSDESLVSQYSGEYNKFINELQAKNLLANNTVDGKRLAVIGNRISVAVEKFMNENGMGDKVKNLDWEFNLVKSNGINAFALPGGKIIFYSGIMPVLKTDAAIAFVMGHEIGHVIGGHHAESQSGKTAAAVVMLGKALADALTGGATSIINNDLVEQGLSIGLLKFNRTQEYEADKYGMIFMAMAGYNPEEAINAEERLIAMEKGVNVEILSTHPSTKNRIEALRNFLPEAMKYYKK